MSSFTEDRINDGIARLRSRWPQSHAIADRYGRHLVFVPGVALPKGYTEDICTVFFMIQPGFPAARPRDFFTDIDIRLAEPRGQMPERTSACVEGFKQAELVDTFPQWAECKRWFWKLQMWDPYRDGLYTYMMCIRQRFNRVV